MNILVVGGAGYIGSHMVSELHDSGYHPVIFDNFSTGHEWAVKGETVVRGDLADRAALKQLFSEHRFDAVFHFASFIQVGESVASPLKYYTNNVANTLNLLSAMQESGVKRLVFSSTAAVYGTPEANPISESAPLKPENPYGHSKLMIEQVLADCDHAWGFKSACLRYFNAAGAHRDAHIGEAHEPETHLIPNIIQVALGKRDRFIVYGDNYDTPDGTCIRDYIHVSDLVTAHSAALSRLLDGDASLVCNLGNGKGYSIYEIIEVCRRISGHTIPVEVAPRRAGDPAQLVASSKKAQEVLGWQPKYPSIDEIVDSAWNWHSRINQHPAS